MEEEQKIAFLKINEDNKKSIMIKTDTCRLEFNNLDLIYFDEHTAVKILELIKNTKKEGK